MSEKPFERDVLDRLITMETKIDTITTQCPICQVKIGAHAIALATVESSVKSAHYRLDGIFDGIYKTAGIISAIVGVVVSGLFMLAEYLFQKGGHGQ